MIATYRDGPSREDPLAATPTPSTHPRHGRDTADPRRRCVSGGCGPAPAQFLARALRLPTTATDYFDDDDGMTGEGSINAMAKVGLTGGCAPRRFCPTAAITREQMAALLYRSLAR
jgi:hypothetical protein